MKLLTISTYHLRQAFYTAHSELGYTDKEINEMWEATMGEVKNKPTTTWKDVK